MSSISPEESKLTDKQRLFVTHYLDSFNATEAVRKAGYNTAHANKLAGQLKANPKIKALIEYKLAPVCHEITPESVKKGIRQTIDECKNPKDRLAGYELLAKILKMFDQPPAVGNIWAIVGKIDARQTAVRFRDIPKTVDLHHPRREGVEQDQTGQVSSGTAIPSATDTPEKTSPEKGQHPPGGSNCNDETSDKNVDQNQSDACETGGSQDAPER